MMPLFSSLFLTLLPTTFPTICSQFGTNYTSHVVHESRVLRVVDSTIPIDNDGTEAEEIKTKTLRRMEFIASPLFAQTGTKMLVVSTINFFSLTLLMFYRSEN